MSEQIFSKNPGTKSTFWSNASKYTSSEIEDEGFVGEVAYMMVTLHRTGA